jgi:hypothetical protein
MSDMVRQMEMALQMGSPVLLQDIEVRGFWVSCVCMHVCVCACACARARARTRVHSPCIILQYKTCAGFE